jgi:hypothetical protein
VEYDGWSTRGVAYGIMYWVGMTGGVLVSGVGRRE